MRTVRWLSMFLLWALSSAAVAAPDQARTTLDRLNELAGSPGELEKAKTGWAFWLAWDEALALGPVPTPLPTAILNDDHLDYQALLINVGDWSQREPHGLASMDDALLFLAHAERWQLEADTMLARAIGTALLGIAAAVVEQQALTEAAAGHRESVRSAARTLEALAERSPAIERTMRGERAWANHFRQLELPSDVELREALQGSRAFDPDCKANALSDCLLPVEVWPLSERQAEREHYDRLTALAAPLMPLLEAAARVEPAAFWRNGFAELDLQASRKLTDEEREQSLASWQRAIVDERQQRLIFRLQSLILHASLNEDFLDQPQSPAPAGWQWDRRKQAGRLCLRPTSVHATLEYWFLDNTCVSDEQPPATKKPG